MADFLAEKGKTVQVILPDSFPSFLDWLPGADKILIYQKDPEACRSFFEKADSILCLDFNALSRIGKLGVLVEHSSAKKLMFDHHPNPDKFADVQISYPQFASSSEIVFRFLLRAGGFDEMSLSCAECVYTGMMTDTGAFTYNSNNEEMYFIISQLIHKGIDKDAIYNKVFSNYSVDRMRLMGFVLNNRMEIFPEYKSAILSLSLDDMKDFDYKVGDTEGFVNLPLSISGIIFSVFVHEDADKIKLSFRSRGTFPVNKIASELFNGGGHLNAAGGEYKGKLKDALHILRDALPKYML
jgi:phosphoesterase RecJ-like protein